MKHMKPITSAGTYASITGITHAAIGPIAASRSERHGCETQTAKPTYASVNVPAAANRTVGRTPNAGRSRAVKPPSRCG